MSSTVSPQSTSKRRTLTTSKIAFMVISAAAPLTAIVGNLPTAFIRGNTIGTPASFLIVAAIIGCFTVGFGAMSGRIVSTGAFYTYVGKGLGRQMAVATALIAILSYVTLTIGLAVYSGYFCALALMSAGVSVPWPLCAFASVVLVGGLGFCNVELSSRVLGILMLAEIVILLLFDISVLAVRGSAALPLAPFAPSSIVSPGLGVTLMIAFLSFIGFESASLYGEETIDPRRSIPRATYASVATIGILYMLSSWIAVGGIGRDVAPTALRDQGGEIVLNLFTRFGGPLLHDVGGVMVCTSLLAAFLAMHNAATRYLFVFSREGLLPAALGRFHPRRYAPVNASIVMSVIVLVAVGGFATNDRNPYTGGAAVFMGIGTLGVIVMQALAGVAIIAYLGRNNRAGPVTIAASVVGAAGLIAASLIVALNISQLITDAPTWIGWMPMIFPLLALAGIAYARRLRTRAPQLYAKLAQVELRSDSQRTVPPLSAPSGRYCIVGAGPCGLLAARAFKIAGIPYDHFERHADVGGIWDLENPGTPMYETAHFISSKTVSNFFGFPMPDSFPDYPTHRQILAYIRAFADAFQLRDGIRFGIEVRSAVPVGTDAQDGWEVTLSDGTSSRYVGIVCAPGVTWHSNIPDIPGIADFTGTILHSRDYRSPALFDDKRVLIVGGGNSGVDIACDAAVRADDATISLRRGYHFLPKHMFGMPTDVFMSNPANIPSGVVVPEDAGAFLTALLGSPTRYGLPAPDHKVLESHPIMNSQILHHLSHGDLGVKGDIVGFDATGVTFVDGTRSDYDVVLLATGYDYRIPYLDSELLTWRHGRPDLYLNIFDRKLRGLSVIGFVEFASAGYQYFDEMAQMIAMDAHIEQSGVGRTEWTALKRGHVPDLRGGKRYIESSRHANYVDVDRFRQVLYDLRERFGWPDPSDALYQTHHTQAAPSLQPC